MKEPFPGAKTYVLGGLLILLIWFGRYIGITIGDDIGDQLVATLLSGMGITIRMGIGTRKAR